MKFFLNVIYQLPSILWALIKTTARLILIYLPLIVAGISIVYNVWGVIVNKNVINLYTDLPNGELSETQATSIDLIIELNKYLISINIGLFGGAGYFIANHQDKFESKQLQIVYLVALIFLGIGFFFAFLIYEEITASLAQNQLALIPGESLTIRNIEFEFNACLGSTLILLTIFVNVLTNIKTKTSV